MLKHLQVTRRTCPLYSVHTDLARRIFNTVSYLLMNCINLGKSPELSENNEETNFTNKATTKAAQ